MSRRVYLDHNASTPVHPEVLAEMLPYFSEHFGIPPACHGFGREARAGLDQARERGGALPSRGAGRDRVHLRRHRVGQPGLKGFALARGRGHLITSKIEHHAVLRAGQWLETQGFTVTYVGVDGHGMIDPDDVKQAIRPDTIGISIMHANSEIGTVQPVAAIGALARAHGIPFHVDAVQTFGKLDLDVAAAGIDLLSFSGHKIYGPKGIAGLWIARAPRWSPCSTGASTSGVAGRAPRTCRVSWAWARRWRSAPGTCTKSGVA
jgi:cysteine desulfurase